ncbi:helix-turn-helix domain-containing protein [Xenorhabdus yunnanensis]|uniref:helix-turn-helix domain-containing protein n=1 Tax=Xenorhabdus yunnanensis TaxID=3025878 RepID=UPI00359C5CBC
MKEHLKKNGEFLPSLQERFYSLHYKLHTSRKAFIKNIQKDEWIITNFIGVEAPIIWPSRYQNYTSKKHEYYEIIYGSNNLFDCKNISLS